MSRTAHCVQARFPGTDNSVKHGSASNIFIDLPVQDRPVPVPALTGASTRSTPVPVEMIGKYRDS